MNKIYNYPVEIDIQPYIYDHRFEGIIIYPAVEACLLLASNIEKYMPDISPSCIYDAFFNKPVYIEENQTLVDAVNELEIHENGTVVSKLLTKKISKRSGISRVNENAKLSFKRYEDIRAEADEFIHGIAPVPEGECLRLTPDKIYKDLIPFGPAYQNLINISLSRHGATGYISGPDYIKKDSSLGCPFVFDAALHAANVWGQRYCNTVGFPIGFESRIIHRPPVSGEKYFTRIIPKPMDSDIIVFDMYIHNLSGNLIESASDVRLKDITRGRIKPVEWILEIS